MVDSDALTLAEVVDEAFKNSKTHGFYDNADAAKEFLSEHRPEYLDAYIRSEIAEKLALIHSEVSEALECLRVGDMTTGTAAQSSKPVGFPSEIADVVIRVADLCGLLGIDLNKEVKMKMRYNRARPYKHGKAL